MRILILIRALFSAVREWITLGGRGVMFVIAAVSRRIAWEPTGENGHGVVYLRSALKWLLVATALAVLTVSTALYGAHGALTSGLTLAWGIATGIALLLVIPLGVAVIALTVFVVSQIPGSRGVWERYRTFAFWTLFSVLAVGLVFTVVPMDQNLQAVPKFLLAASILVLVAIRQKRGNTFVVFMKRVALVLLVGYLLSFFFPALSTWTPEKAMASFTKGFTAESRRKEFVIPLLGEDTLSELGVKVNSFPKGWVCSYDGPPGAWAHFGDGTSSPLNGGANFGVKPGYTRFTGPAGENVYVECGPPQKSTRLPTGLARFPAASNGTYAASLPPVLEPPMAALEPVPSHVDETCDKARDTLIAGLPDDMDTPMWTWEWGGPEVCWGGWVTLPAPWDYEIVVEKATNLEIETRFGGRYPLTTTALPFQLVKGGEFRVRGIGKAKVMAKSGGGV